MNPVLAYTARRSAVVGGALATTLIAHAVTTGGLALLPVAPFAWLGLIAVAALAGRGTRRVRFHLWGLPRVFVTVVAAQAAMHVVMHEAPWLFGVMPHHHGALITTSAAVAHAVAAVLLTVAVCYGQRLLAAAAAVVKALRGVRRARPLPRGVVVVCVASPTVGSQRRVAVSRGPPRWSAAV